MDESERCVPLRRLMNDESSREIDVIKESDGELVFGLKMRISRRKQREGENKERQVFWQI